MKEFDAIITRFCLDSCSPTLNLYDRAFENMRNVVKPGGYIIQIGFYDDNRESWGTGFWNLGNKKVSDIRLTKKEIEKVYENSNVKVVGWKTLHFDANDAKDFQCTSTFVAFLKA